jgi:beta-hydroxylase
LTADEIIQAILRPRVIIVALLLASVLYVHFRGRVRLKFARQVTDHSTFTAPYNALVYLFSRAPTTPFVDAAAFPQLKPLIENWKTIRDEGERLWEKGMVRPATGDNDLGFHTFFKRGWTRFYLSWYGHVPPSAAESCPKTIEVLKAAPAVKGAMFTVLPPGAKLGRHRDPFAGSLRLHLGLKTPNSDACWIEVDGQRKSWRDGEAMVFDETYVHEALNETDQHRLILLCDFERPLWQPMAFLNHLMMRGVMSATVTQNVEGEKIGAINRFFGSLYGVKNLGQGLKKKNRKLYYAIKNAVLVLMAVGVLAWLFLGFVRL